jgi:type IV pilus assembly protein PilM
MAKASGVWGIDIGQCALKALRCRLEGETVVADAFDFIEYPKLLSQQDAKPQELVKEALEQFLSRNDLKGDKVCISVAGQSGLARYFKPPPVDAKKIADIVKYEAKQQIPFPLEDVIWDYQRMGGGTEVDGIALETEVGLFAMKREQVFKALHPLVTAGIAVDIIQLAPLCIYNYVVYDLLDRELPPPQDFDPDNPPPSTVVVSIGTDTTDLVVTNGYRVWQRNIPLGGNHFTKQLTKELKHTFAKAEHVKRNAHQAEDPKALFQAMRSVFGDMVTELQRSLSFFQNLDRKATIEKVVVLGNTIKLPGLKQYLTKHLGYELIDFETFERLTGDSVTNSPSFRDNLLAFGPCYGLCLQGLGLGRLQTNLLPLEIKTERIIKAKKPWAVAAAATFMLGCVLNYSFHCAGRSQVELTPWQPKLDAVSRTTADYGRYKSQDDEKKSKLTLLTKVAEEVVGNPDRRVLWLELNKAILDSLPITPGRQPGELLDNKKFPFEKQHELHITSIESQYFPDVKFWFEGSNGLVKRRYEEFLREQEAPAAAVATDPTAATTPMGQTPMGPAAPVPVAQATLPSATTPMPGSPSGAPAAPGAAAVSTTPSPQGPGWVIELRGYHFRNAQGDSQTAGTHVKKTLMQNLLKGSVKLSAGEGKGEREFTMQELGIGYPILADNPPLERNFIIENPNYIKTKQAAVDVGGFGAGETPAIPTANTDEKEDPNNPRQWRKDRYNFVVQFVWQEKPLKQRIEAQQAAAAAAAALAPQQPGVPGAIAPAPMPVGGNPVAPTTAPATPPTAPVPMNGGS